MSFGDQQLLGVLNEISASSQRKERLRAVVAFDGFVDEIKRVIKHLDPQGMPVYYASKSEFLNSIQNDWHNKDETQESSIRSPTATAALTSISTAMNETTVRQNCFLKNISKVSAYKRPQRGSMTSCSPFLWNPGNPRCFFDAGHILIKKMAGNTSRNRTVEICFCRVSVFSRTHPKAVKNNLSRLLTRRNLRCIMSAF